MSQIFDVRPFCYGFYNGKDLCLRCAYAEKCESTSESE